MISFTSCIIKISCQKKEYSNSPQEIITGNVFYKKNVLQFMFLLSNLEAKSAGFKN